MIGIYKITSPSGKIYIGQSWDIDLRFAKYHQVRWDKQRKLYASFKSYGLENHVFEVVHELPKDVDQEVIDIYEILYISQYRELGIELLNIREGGSRGKHSEETKTLFKSNLNLFSKGHSVNKGRKQSDDERKRRSIKSKLIQSSPEFKNKMRDAVLNSSKHKEYREKLQSKNI